MVKPILGEFTKPGTKLLEPCCPAAGRPPLPAGQSGSGIIWDVDLRGFVDQDT